MDCAGNYGALYMCKVLIVILITWVISLQMLYLRHEDVIVEICQKHNVVLNAVKEIKCNNS